MLIESKIKRQGGSYIELGGITYHFAPNAEGRHVCKVDNDEHVDRLLSIPEGFRLYRETPATAAPEQKPKKEAKTVTKVAAGHKETSGLAPDGKNEGEGEGEGGTAGGAADKGGSEDTGDTKEPATDDREALVALYVEKFGRKPHGKWDAERIRKELESE